MEQQLAHSAIAFYLGQVAPITHRHQPSLELWVAARWILRGLEIAFPEQDIPVAAGFGEENEGFFPRKGLNAAVSPSEGETPPYIDEGEVLAAEAPREVREEGGDDIGVWLEACGVQAIAAWGKAGEAREAVYFAEYPTRGG